jgi:hypothetical protein
MQGFFSAANEAKAQEPGVNVRQSPAVPPKTRGVSRRSVDNRFFPILVSGSFFRHRHDDGRHFCVADDAPEFHFRN